MSCHAWQDLLNQHLDEGSSPDELERHAAACPDCAVHWPAVRQLLSGIARLRPPILPSSLQEQITARLLTEVRVRSSWHRRVLPWTGLAAAASLVLAVGLWAWKPAGGVDSIARNVDPDLVASVPAEPLRESMEQAGDAVAALTSRTASETAERTSLILPFVRQTAEPFADMPEGLEPPLEPFREATQGVSSGLAPVAESARRAVGLFLRDLPMAPP